MKKIIAIVLILSICFCLPGCKTSDYKDAIGLFEQQNYKDAAIAFEVLGDYKDSQVKLKECKYNLALILLDLKEDPLSEAPTRVVSTVYESLASAKDMNEAKSLLEYVGDYEDSVHILTQLNNLQEYNTAISLFEGGKFSEALPIFKELINIESFYAQRYITAIDVLSKVSGEWKGTLSGDIDYDDYLTDQLSNGSIQCKIGPPYSIGSSWFSDCDWMVNATINLNAQYYVINCGWSGNDLSHKSFSRTVQEGFHHQQSDQEDVLGESIYITNDNAYDFLFTPSSGIYSRIFISFNSDYSKLTIMELPYDMNWSTSYMYDSYSVELAK